MLWYQRKDKSLVMLSKFAAFEADISDLNSLIIGYGDTFNGAHIEWLDSEKQANTFLDWLQMQVICEQFLDTKRHYWTSYEEFIDFEKGDEENGERSDDQQRAG